MQDNIPLTYTLSNSICIDSVENTVSKLKEVLNKRDDPLNLTLDAGNVEVITTPGIQVIVALGKMLEQQGSKFAISNPSKAFLEGFFTLGLRSHLEKWSHRHG